jgi:hypothetical protein
MAAHVLYQDFWDPLKDDRDVPLCSSCVDADAFVSAMTSSNPASTDHIISIRTSPMIIAFAELLLDAGLEDDEGRQSKTD